jgi:phage terminase small subunit
MAENIESFEDLGLTEKQRLFCEAYVVDCKASKAIIATGSPAKNAMQMGYEMLKVPKVKAYIKFLRSKAADVAGVTAIRNAQALTEIAYDETGEVANKDRIKAVEVLNKMFGLNEAKKVDVTITNEHEKMTDEELMDLIEKKRKLRESLSE